MKKIGILLAFASAVTYAGSITTQAASVNGTTFVANDITGFATTGNQMGGLVIIGDFASGADATCTWVNGGGSAGGCNSLGGGSNSFSLSLNGDTFSASWNLGSILGANLVSLTFHGGGSGNGFTVFDRDNLNPGTTNSAQGNDASGDTNNGSGSNANNRNGIAVYSNRVSTLGNGPAGDLFTTVTITFNNNLTPGNTADWVMDTDNIGVFGGNPGSNVPEPSTFGMVGAGLIGLAWLRRTRK